MEVLQTSALPLGDGAPLTDHTVRLKPDTTYFGLYVREWSAALEDRTTAFDETRVVDHRKLNIGAGNGIRTRDFDLGKVALYH
jgi:hypothetical protein